MARIPEEEIERLKSEIPIRAAGVAASAIELKRHGADLMGLCPFHDDHDAVAGGDAGKNLWHCLGACNRPAAGVIDWVMKTRGVSFRHAVELLRVNHPSLAAGASRVVRKSTATRLESPIERKPDDQRVCARWWASITRR